MSEEKQGRPSIERLARRQVYANHWMRVYEDRILRSNGVEGIYGVVEKDESAIILPVEAGRVWLVEQFRYAIGERALEFPQGGWERAIEHPEELARGELKEELGLEAECMTPLGMLWIAYGFVRQPQYVYLATGLTETQRLPDKEEHDLVVRSLEIEEFERRIVVGEIRDQCTVSAWGLYKLWQERKA